MRVHIEGDLYLGSSTYGFQLERKQIIQSGKSAGTVTYAPFRYYSTITACIKALVEMKIAELPEDKITTLKELQGAIKVIQHEIETKILI